MTLYQFLKEMTLASYPVCASADVFVDDRTSLYLELPVSQELPPYSPHLEYPANIVSRKSLLASQSVFCVAPYLKGSVAELRVYIKMDRKALEAVCRQIDEGTLLGEYWNA